MMHTGDDKHLSCLHAAFPAITGKQLQTFREMCHLYLELNDRINLISRKDVAYIATHHILHSLTPAKFFHFKPEMKILDIGTGGGFPGLPLAVMFPMIHVTLSDRIEKKIRAIEYIVKKLRIENALPCHSRGEEIEDRFDFVVCRALAPLKTIIHWTEKKIRPACSSKQHHGIICLKGGNLKEELEEAGRKAEVYKLADHFKQPYFKEKKIIFIPVTN